MSTIRSAERLFIKKVKGCPPEETGILELSASVGISGDIHSAGDRQVCLVFSDTAAKIGMLKGSAPCIDRFSCNITVSGNKPDVICKGTEVVISDAVLEITAVGRDCHGLCSLEKCPLVDGILFARVVRDGIIRTGDKVQL